MRQMTQTFIETVEMPQIPPPPSANIAMVTVIRSQMMVLCALTHSSSSLQGAKLLSSGGDLSRGPGKCFQLNST
jgi:hypothetical protein